MGEVPGLLLCEGWGGRERESERGICGQRQRHHVCVCKCVHWHAVPCTLVPHFYSLLARSVARARARERSLSFGHTFPNKPLCPSFPFPGEEVSNSSGYMVERKRKTEMRRRRLPVSCRVAVTGESFLINFSLSLSCSSSLPPSRSTVRNKCLFLSPSPQ